MKASTAVPLAIILVVCSFLAGWFLPRFMESGETADLVSLAETAHPDLDFSHCRRSPVANAQDCLDAVLANAAVSAMSDAVCADIANSSTRSQCAARVALLSSLSQGSAAFCADLSTDPLCMDLATTLNARLSQKRELCSDIGNEGLRGVCFALFPDVNTPAPAVTSGDTSVPPRREYGLSCLQSDTACNNAKPAFRAAVAAKSEQQCVMLGLYKDLCLSEIALYRAYTENNDQLCQARHPQEICQLQLTIARALDGDPNLCANLTEGVQQQTCVIEVEASLGQKRFDYLQG